MCLKKRIYVQRDNSRDPFFFLNSHSCSFTTMCFFYGQRLHKDKVLCKQKIITRQIKIVVFQIIVRRSLEIGFNFQGNRKELPWTLSYPKYRIQELSCACSKTLFCLTGYSQILNPGCDSTAVKTKQERKSLKFIFSYQLNILSQSKILLSLFLISSWAHRTE